MLTIGSLFSGIGGLELGLEWAGLGPVLWQVEQDPFCRGILEKHWPGVERHDDVRTVGAATLAPVDLICGGFPCQDISSAGKGAGLTGERSGLWFEFLRTVTETRPRWVVVENVASGAARWVDPVLVGLGEQGYAALPVHLSAKDVGAPHIRRRVFVVAHSYGQGQSAQPLHAKVGRVPDPAGALADSDRQRQQGTHGAESPRTGGVAECPWADNPMPEPALRRVDDGLPARMDRNKRLRALGNAVVPQCAEVIGHMITELLQ